ncbi:ubiquinol oxidase polypeptide II [Rhodopseudomonas sp. B29]|uniref:ubiquinol oxidase polypeptide II n=1 Tax=Rhodopseudomonas sp. B29 TaxID=95607 RepID=UPI0003459AAF|nr:ubiquinol oxidase polypeptide II [Rhodopseudomonas sp. B29]
MNILAPQGPVGVGNATILIDSVVIMLAIVVPTIVAILAFAFWFRHSNTRANYRPDFTYSGRVEMVVWGIPTLTIILLGGVTWIGSHQLDPAKPVEGTGSPVRIQAVSLDWKWLFIYPDQRIATINTLTVPIGAPLQIELTSASVMNAFFVPQLGSMIYSMNGMVSHLNLRADRIGTLQGLSSHFSGDGFPDMKFDVNVVSPIEFPDWVAQAAKNGTELNADTYKKLMAQSTESGKPTFRLTDPRLFEAISTLKIPPQPGPKLFTEAAQTHQGTQDAR